MKRAELIRHLTGQGCELFREGGLIHLLEPLESQDHGRAVFDILEIDVFAPLRA
jgi:hypothetical protein